MIKAVVGANWGDEGKGKITDMLAQEADIIVRFQGGANAGHTIVNDYGKFALHTLPSGVFYNHTTSVIGNGVALNIPVFFKEYNEVVSRGGNGDTYARRVPPYKSDCLFCFLGGLFCRLAGVLCGFLRRFCAAFPCRLCILPLDLLLLHEAGKGIARNLRIVM